MNHRRNPPPPSRGTKPITSRCRGFLLVELIVAMILVGTVAAVLPVALNAVYRQRQQERFERLTQLELSNVVTRLSVEVRAIDPEAIRLSTWFREMYPDASLEITLGQQPKDIPIIPVTVSIRRPRGDSQPPLQQTLTTWLEWRETHE